MSKLKKLLVTAGIFCMAFGALTACVGKDDAVFYGLTLMSGEEVISSGEIEENNEVNEPTQPQKIGYRFEGWYFSADFSGEQVVFPFSMTGDVTLYAKFIKQYELNYQLNLVGVQAQGEVPTQTGVEGETFTVADGADYQVNGYLFLGWSTSANGVLSLAGEKNDGQYAVGEEISVAQSITLYAQWAIGYENLDKNSAARVYFYEPLYGQGLGAGILTREGEENKLGFMQMNAQSGNLEFTFMFDEAEGGDIVGRIYLTDKTFRIQDKSEGVYCGYSHIYADYTGDFLASDGYGYATVSRPQSGGSATEWFGRYEYDAEYGDYRLVLLDVSTGEPILDSDGNEQVVYYRLNAEKIQNFDGSYQLLGEESGTYLFYENGVLSQDKFLSLSGYGEGKIYALDESGENQTLLNEGIYRGTEEYSSFQGEWIYAQGAQNEMKFLLNAIQDTDGSLIPVCIPYNESWKGEFVNGSDILYLDGYGGASYTTLGQTLLGVCTVGEQTLVTFIPYLEEGAGGKMYFNIDRATGRFSVSPQGFLVDGTRLIGYEGNSPIVVIPDGVTEIAEGALSYQSVNCRIVSVTIPASVKKIGAKAFENDSSLSRVIFLSQTPVEIDFSAENDPFRWPSGNFLLVVPEGAQEAYRSAWNTEYSIKGAEEVDLLPEFEIEDGVLVRYNTPKDAGETVTLTLPDEVTEIAESVFRGLSHIVGVNFNNVTKIGARAFESCVNLAFADFTKVEEIGDSAFLFCSLGKEGEIRLPSVKTVGANAFQGNILLERVVFGLYLESIGDYAFKECRTEVGQSPFFVELNGNNPPQMGLDIGVGNIAFRLQVPNVRYAITSFDNQTWEKYWKNLYIPSGDEKGVYYDGAEVLELDGRAILNYTLVYLYEIQSNVITLIPLPGNGEKNTSGMYLDGEILIDFQMDKGVWLMRRSSGEVTYTSSDGKFTLVCDPAKLNSEENETISALLNGVEVSIEKRGFKKVIKAFSYEGKDVDITLQLLTGGKNEFNYTMTESDRWLAGLTAKDGSELTFYFKGDLIYVSGQLNFEVAEGVKLPAIGLMSTVATQTIASNVYEFTVKYREDVYHITVTVLADNVTFTYKVTPQP